MKSYFDVTYEVTMPLKPESALAFAPQVIEAIQQQQRLPVLIWPDQPEGSTGINIHSTQHGMAATFTTESDSVEDVRRDMMLGHSRVASAVGAPKDYGPHVREDFVSREAHMPFRYVIQLRAQTGADHDKLFVVYEAGAAYQIPGDVLAKDLEDPFNPLFSSDKVRRLSPEEAQAVQEFEIRHGGPNYVPIWADGAQYSGYQPGGDAEQFVSLNVRGQL